MDFIDHLQALASKIEKLRDKIQTEEATKQAFILPFIQILGYEIWDPTEVIPEYIADVGIKKGEKIDYAICRDGKPIILIECKHCETNLEKITITQLYRYFSVVEARVAILTNGVVYKFFADVDEPNKMDSKPFLTVDLTDLQDGNAAQLKQLTKDNFDISTMLSTAVELKYTHEVKRLISEQFHNPSDEIVRYFAAQVYAGGKLTQAVRDQFGDIVKRAFHQYLNEHIASRLKGAFHPEDGMRISISSESAELPAEEDAGDVVTTEEELEGFMVVKAILREVVDLKRIAARDTKSYFGVLLDDNNRKPICRLRFNYTQKYLCVMDAGKNEIRHAIASVDDIYRYANELKQAALQYDLTKVGASNQGADGASVVLQDGPDVTAASVGQVIPREAMTEQQIL